MSRMLPASTLMTGTWTWRALAALLILAVSAARIAYLACNCPLDLAPDEAHYWDWSRHLDWSYYSKGPLIAYLIRGGLAVAGKWSQHLMANEMLAVRLPAVICGGLLLASLYLLTRQIYQREGLALAVVALSLALPVIGAGSLIMTIDAPYTCCWGWALVLGYQAVFRRSAWAWPMAGLVVGIGILAKYTMVLWLPSIGFFLITSPAHRRLLLGPGFWIMTLVAATSCLPILLWNLQHNWVSLRHVNGLAGLNASAAGIHWLGPLIYLGSQCGLFLVFWFVAWLAAMFASRPWVETNAGRRYLWWMSAPMFLVFLAFSLKTGGGEPNWPVTAYESGLVLTVAWLARQLQSPRRWYRVLVAVHLGEACVVGLILTMAMHRTDVIHPLLCRLCGPPTPQNPFPLRRFDPTCRLRGWRTLAEKIDEIRSELKKENLEPVLAGTSWALPGEIGFYCHAHPTVYSVGLPLGDRHSQYDFWRPNPVLDPGPFTGRTFIIVGTSAPELDKVFEHVEPTRIITYYEEGQPIGCWGVTVCRGFRGFDPLGKPVGQKF